MGVGDCRWPKSANINVSILTCCDFRNSAPSSASAAEAATNFRISHVMIMGLLRLIAFPLIGKIPKKNILLLCCMLCILIGMTRRSAH